MKQKSLQMIIKGFATILPLLGMIGVVALLTYLGYATPVFIVLISKFKDIGLLLIAIMVLLTVIVYQMTTEMRRWIYAILDGDSEEEE